MSEIGMRIQSRLELLDKSASAASLEAELGRSAVQDIITGKSQNPRLDTLRKLTGPLQCSLSYLTGEPPERIAKTLDIEWGEQNNSGERVHRVEIQGLIQYGTIRGNDDDLSDYAPVFFVERDARFPNSDLIGYLMADKTLSHIQVSVDDILLLIPSQGLSATLRTGSVVVMERLIPHAFEGEFHEGTETSAREVQFSNGDLHLTLGGHPTKTLVVPAIQVDEFVSGKTLEKTMVRLIGCVVRTMREMPA